MINRTQNQTGPCFRIAIGYPPLTGKNKFGRLSQNRQFFWSPVASFVFPVVPASAATLLGKSGHDVLWLDGMAEKITVGIWLQRLKQFNPDFLTIETKTPVIKYHWQIAKKIKSLLPRCQIILVGDHVTALPRETLESSEIDYVITGGNYDFLLLDLIGSIGRGEKIPPGVWFRKNGKIVSSGPFILNQNLNSLPFIDRKLTKWHLYSRDNGNFKYYPAAYIMAGRDCWWRRNGGCSFCSWTTLYPKYSVRSPANVLDEIGMLIDDFGVREIFDDTGTFPVGLWLREFCRGMINRGYHRKIRFGCNFRFGVLDKTDYGLLARAGFRFLLFGLESANQKTVDRLGKGIMVPEIAAELKMIRLANRNSVNRLEPHLTYMLGYPWETAADAENTVRMAGSLFAAGLVNTIQATVVVPYPGTRLFREAQKNDWLTTLNWNDYDMSRSVMKLKISQKKLSLLVKNMYLSCFSPAFIAKRLTSVRTLADAKYLVTGAFKAVRHAANF